MEVFLCYYERHERIYTQKLEEYPFRIKGLEEDGDCASITTILGSLGGLATSYIDGKAAVQKAEAQIRMKEATGEIDWELCTIRATQSSWKDEWLTILFSLPLILCFCGDWGTTDRD